jgi:putative SbcD/Mre11-related phosphoesterase
VSAAVDGALRPSVTLPDGIVLLPPGGAYVPDERALVIADPHVGYLPTLHARGHGVPAARDDELVARVGSLLSRVDVSQLVIAGDLVHGLAATRSARGPSALERFVKSVGKRRIRVAVGNHDRRAHEAFAKLGLHAEAAVTIGPHVVLHGDDLAAVSASRRIARRRGGRVILGHLHPAFAVDDATGTRRWAPAFVTARGVLCLPALSPWSRGLDVRSSALQAQLDERIPSRFRRGLALVVGRSMLALGSAWRTRDQADARGRTLTRLRSRP